ncbi:Uncharacterised protein [uncultured archaeon]|nr:Uncharacterised protein [uncultured archaeon]
MRKTLAAILTGISLAFGNMTRADDLPTEINVKNGRYYTTEQVIIERKDDALRKVIDRTQQSVYLRGIQSDCLVYISYSTHPVEQNATRPKQGFSSKSRIFIGVPEGVKVQVLEQRAETIGNFDKVTMQDLRPLDETKCAQTFLKMGNNGLDKLRAYDPIQKATESLNDSIFLLTGTDLNLEDKISIYGGLKAFSDTVDKKEKERGKSTFKGELEMQEIVLWPRDAVFSQPSETLREINFRINPGTYSGEKIPFTVYQKLVLGREPTEGIGKLEAFFTGEVENKNAKTQNGNNAPSQLGIIEALSALQGYWKYSESPGDIKQYLTVTVQDKNTINIQNKAIGPFTRGTAQETVYILSYDSEKKLFTVEKKGIYPELDERQQGKIGPMGLRRLTDQENREINTKINDFLNWSRNFPFGDFEGPLNGGNAYTIRKKQEWDQYMQSHPNLWWDEETKPYREKK